MLNKKLGFRVFISSNIKLFCREKILLLLICLLDEMFNQNIKHHLFNVGRRRVLFLYFWNGSCYSQKRREFHPSRFFSFPPPKIFFISLNFRYCFLTYQGLYTLQKDVLTELILWLLQEFCMVNMYYRYNYLFLSWFSRSWSPFFQYGFNLV